MIPRANIITLEKHQSLEDMVKVIEEYDYTRYPMTDRESKKSAFIGFINTKEMMTDIAAGRTSPIDNFIHPIPRFKHTTLIKDVFVKMQKTRTHMALVSDDQNKTVGLVTMEDILSEIVGDIHDEEGTLPIA